MPTLLLAADTIGRSEIIGVLIALIIAAIVGLVLHLIAQTRPYSGPVAVITFLVLLVLLLV